ncbi:expressed unknown protein [Seminavis robusta]|uniref:Uncharacterized protein n=1 Tax=Seminavis robusta TaxID=568900 RepID=A0A9N8HAK0_9STRA|nr:expressed unknown protein [Seminavis robusta]|eukprot:Sro299_g111430.1 n/a (282) ;mRNA; f:51712-52647
MSKPKAAQPVKSSPTSSGQHDASIIITSSLIPMFPSIMLTNSTIQSLHKHLIGLPLDVPIFISVDRPPDSQLNEGDNKQRLEEYIQRLQKADFAPFTNVKVVPMEVHRHLAGSINHTLALHVKTPIFYIIEHNAPFLRNVEHEKLVQTMKQNPDVLQNIRFLLQDEPHAWTVRKSSCHVKKSARQFKENGKDFVRVDVDVPSGDLKLNGMEFYVTSSWRSYNQITSREYYDKMLKEIAYLVRDPRWPMERNAQNDCSQHGQQVYGPRLDAYPYIQQLSVGT